MTDRQDRHRAITLQCVTALSAAWAAVAGCRMKGNGFTSGLEPKWYTFLQELSDAIVFEGTPPQFPPYPWSNSGPKCTLKP